VHVKCFLYNVDHRCWLSCGKILVVWEFSVAYRYQEFGITWHLKHGKLSQSSYINITSSYVIIAEHYRVLTWNISHFANMPIRIET